MIDAPRGHIADHHTADLQAIPGRMGLVQVTGENSRLKTENRIIDFIERRVEIIEFRQDRDGTKGLLSCDVFITGHIFEQCGLEHRALTLTTA